MKKQVGSRQSVVVISGTSNYYAQRAYATMIYGHRTEEVALRRKWYDDEFLVVQWGGGLKGRAKPWEIKYTNQFSSKLDLPFPCWTESNRPSRTSRWCWRRRSIWCCDAWCFELSSLSFSLYLSLYLYLFGYWTAIVADVFLVVVFVLGFNYLIWQYFSTTLYFTV